MNVKEFVRRRKGQLKKERKPMQILPTRRAIDKWITGGIVGVVLLSVSGAGLVGLRGYNKRVQREQYGTQTEPRFGIQDRGEWGAVFTFQDYLQDEFKRYDSLPIGIAERELAGRLRGIEDKLDFGVELNGKEESLLMGSGMWRAAVFGKGNKFRREFDSVSRSLDETVKNPLDYENLAVKHGEPEKYAGKLFKKLTGKEVPDFLDLNIAAGIFGNRPKGYTDEVGEKVFELGMQVSSMQEDEVLRGAAAYVFMVGALATIENEELKENARVYTSALQRDAVERFYNYDGGLRMAFDNDIVHGDAALTLFRGDVDKAYRGLMRMGNAGDLRKVIEENYNGYELLKYKRNGEVFEELGMRAEKLWERARGFGNFGVSQ